MKFLTTVLEKRFWLILGFKVCLITLSMICAILLRYDFMVSAEHVDLFFRLLLPLLAIKLAVFWRMGLNHGWWRYVSISDVIDILLANVLASSLFFLYVTLIHGLENVPRSVLILDGILCFAVGCGVRLATRAYRERYLPINPSQQKSFKRFLVVGAGSAGQMIVREMRVNQSLSMSVIGYIDDDPDKLNKRFQGIPVLGTREDMCGVCAQFEIEEIIIAIPSATGRQLRELVECCRATGLRFKTLPGVGDLIDGHVTVREIKEVDVQDLLCRDPARLEIEKIKGYLEGKRILVTGAAGSIGSEICRQVARFHPGKLILFDKAETPLFFLEKEFRERHPDLCLTRIIGDIRDRLYTNSIFKEFLPDVVFHAAAYKHVPMLEDNPDAAISNNINGTRHVADAAHYFGVKHFVMISTDKAVNPSNVMGTTKRVAELYVQSLSRSSKTNFVTVRFGNVLGSNGSVIPIFREQIEKGGPLTVTHPDVVRFFMTIPEAAQLVLQAGGMGKGGEIFLLDMGEQVRIVTLAEEMIRLSGFKPYEDIDIIFTGLRPGEKLFEELLLSGEGIKSTSHEKIRVAQATECDMKILHRQLDDLREATRLRDSRRMIALLEEIVPEYRLEKKRQREYLEKEQAEASRLQADYSPITAA